MRRWVGIWLVLVLAAACGGGTGDDSSGDQGGGAVEAEDPPEYALAEMLVDEFEEPASAATALVLALDQGYSLQQIADAAYTGALVADGSVPDIEPAEAPSGVVVLASLGAGPGIGGRWARPAVVGGPDDAITDEEVRDAFSVWIARLDDAVAQARDDEDEARLAEANLFGEDQGLVVVAVVAAMAEAGYSVKQITELVIAQADPGAPTEFYGIKGSRAEFIDGLLKLVACEPQPDGECTKVEPEGEPRRFDVPSGRTGGGEASSDGGGSDSEGDGPVTYEGSVTGAPEGATISESRAALTVDEDQASFELDLTQQGNFNWDGDKYACQAWVRFVYDGTTAADERLTIPLHFQDAEVIEQEGSCSGVDETIHQAEDEVIELQVTVIGDELEGEVLADGQPYLTVYLEKQ